MSPQELERGVVYRRNVIDDAKGPQTRVCQCLDGVGAIGYGIRDYASKALKTRQ